MVRTEVELSFCVIWNICLYLPVKLLRVLMDRMVEVVVVVGLWVIKTCCPHKGRLMAAAALTHSSAPQIIHLIKRIILSDDGVSTSVIRVWISHTHTHTQSDFPAYVHHQMLFHILMCLFSFFFENINVLLQQQIPSTPVCHPRSGSTKHHTFSRLSQILWQTHTETPQWDCAVPDTWRSAASQNSLRGSQTEELGVYTSIMRIKLWSRAWSAKPFKHKYTRSQRYVSEERPPTSRFCWMLQSETGLGRRRSSVYLSIFISDFIIFTCSVGDSWCLLKAGVRRKRMWNLPVTGDAGVTVLERNKAGVRLIRPRFNVFDFFVD